VNSAEIARRAVFAGLVAAGAAAGLPAEEVARVAPGSRARVTPAAGGERLIGTVVAVDDRTLSLRIQDRMDVLVLQREEIARLAISQGRRSRGRGALYGAIIGAGVGAAIGVVGGVGSNSSGDEKTKGTVESGLVLAFLGAPVGALVGLVLPPGERWMELPPRRIQVRLAPVHGRGGAVSVTFDF
jgi:hypothetical protein